jgi:hypothetical protein
MDRAKIETVKQQSQANTITELLGLVGEKRMAEYQYFEDTQSQRGAIDRLQNLLVANATQLSPEQHESMIAILAQFPLQPKMYDVTVTSSAIVSEAAVAHAQNILSPSQLSALKHLQDGQQAFLQQGAIRNYANTPPR